MSLLDLLRGAGGGELRIPVNVTDEIRDMITDAIILAELDGERFDKFRDALHGQERVRVRGGDALIPNTPRVGNWAGGADPLLVIPRTTAPNWTRVYSIIAPPVDCPEAMFLGIANDLAACVFPIAPAAPIRVEAASEIEYFVAFAGAGPYDVVTLDYGFGTPPGV
jgi:hypothetical protein